MLYQGKPAHQAMADLLRVRPARKTIEGVFVGVTPCGSSLAPKVPPFCF